MASQSFSSRSPLYYDNNMPIYTEDDSVARRTYLMDDVVRPSEIIGEHYDGVCYMDKLKAKSTRNRDKARAIVDPFTKENAEDFTVIWLDDTLDTDERDVRGLNALREVAYFLRTFTNPDSCQAYVESIPKETVFLITSGSLGRTFVPLVHDLPQIRAIYVLCHRISVHIQWASEFAKIRSGNIFNRVQSLVERLKIDLYKCRYSTGITYKIERSVIDVHDKKADFKWSCLLVQTLIRSLRDERAHRDMITYLREYYKNR
ncbi:unnamed protein product [Didymodactylos carnosus]|uniref:Uncharacterized protein n=1 Tax=Didymodactylos carnosus TaxID=1234261 RepID=A0A815XB90_9BILA|nr:unnamed protein product [Didymodactylos carnosus]CAF1555243.1 unnamed protein product [Didymodactylos carnosus]CAF3826763.1 unnamed protein product [Didymodactylos carnosus]CAF4416375.1 unnamed protein product [Didymodactylos carnosus]